VRTTLETDWNKKTYCQVMSHQSTLSKYFKKRINPDADNIPSSASAAATATSTSTALRGDEHNTIKPKRLRVFYPSSDLQIKDGNSNFHRGDGDNEVDSSSCMKGKEIAAAAPAAEAGENFVLEPGIVLMKHFLSSSEQQAIADMSFEKGDDEQSGFYKPKVLIWNKLCQMKINQMCLGLHWNARLHKYEETRSDHDNSRVHPLPDLFRQTCARAVEASKALDPANIPSSSPNSCIVNFYEEGATLGFHRDASESKQNIREGRPVISLSVGSTAEFQYYHGKDGRSSKKTILLESGDVLVFGGPARLMYHGVPKVHIEKFPEHLNMKKGRLNVTFREI